jgi:hypothetical protein
VNVQYASLQLRMGDLPVGVRLKYTVIFEIFMHCAGSDGVKIWNLVDEIPIRIPGGSGLRGATTALVWIRRDDEVEDGLVYGTQAGYLVGWKERRGEKNV